MSYQELRSAYTDGCKVCWDKPEGALCDLHRAIAQSPIGLTMPLATPLMTPDPTSPEGLDAVIERQRIVDEWGDDGSDQYESMIYEQARAVPGLIARIRELEAQRERCGRCGRCGERDGCGC